MKTIETADRSEPGPANSGSVVAAMALAFAAGALFTRRPSLAVMGALAGAVTLVARSRGKHSKPVEAPRPIADPPVTSTVAPASIPVTESEGRMDDLDLDCDGDEEALDPLPEVPGETTVLPDDSTSALGSLAGLTLPEVGARAPFDAAGARMGGAPTDVRTGGFLPRGTPAVESGACLASPSIASSGGSPQAHGDDESVKSVNQETTGAHLTIKALPGAAVVEPAQRLGTEIIPRPTVPQSAPDAIRSAESGGHEMRLSKSPPPPEISRLAPTARTAAPGTRKWMRWWR